MADISIIICTHLHPDHFGLAGKIKQLSPKAELFAHGWEAATIDSRYIKVTELEGLVAVMLLRYGVPELQVPVLSSASLPILPFVTIAFPNRLLYGGELIKIGGYNLEVIWTPGHSHGHICLFESTNRLLFSGDHVLPTITPNVSAHVQSGDNPLGDYIGALLKLRGLPVRMVLSGHEEIFPDLQGRVDELVEHHRTREEEVFQAVDRKPRSAYELAQHVTWSIEEKDWDKWQPFQKRLAICETIAHLNYMRWRGKVEMVIVHNRVLFRSP